ncbi:hypothetical protein GW17_00053966, partial [Ensete ventricosum]
DGMHSCHFSIQSKSLGRRVDSHKGRADDRSITVLTSCNHPIHTLRSRKPYQWPINPKKKKKKKQSIGEEEHWRATDMASATLIPAASKLILSSSSSTRSFPRLSPFSNASLPCRHRSVLFAAKRAAGDAGNRSSTACAAVGTAASEVEPKRKSSFELQTLTTWLLKQEQAGSIDAELTIVLSSISMACKQIASLVQRAGISNLTGVQGAVNVQGEDQKKLDVVSNEVMAQKCVVNVCQPGNNLLAAGYCMYSSSVIFVLTVGKGVYVFTLDPLYGEFVLTQEDVKIPPAGKIYAFNEGNYLLWDDKLRAYMDSLKDPGPSGKPYSARYIGSLVGDFHRTLLYGGIYGYPRDKKSKNGKLRLLYECAPMSFIVEQAGGKGSDGHQRILDIQPQEVSTHECCTSVIIIMLC